MIKLFLIAGLGNPEEDYSNTRHNMGFDTINKLAKQYKIEVNKNKFKGLYGIGNIDAECDHGEAESHLKSVDGGSEKEHVKGPFSLQLLLIREIFTLRRRLPRPWREP